MCPLFKNCNLWHKAPQWWTGYDILPVGVNMWVSSVLWWTGVPSRVCPCLVPIVFGTGSRSTATLTSVKHLLKNNECMNLWQWVVFQPLPFFQATSQNQTVLLYLYPSFHGLFTAVIHLSVTPFPKTQQIHLPVMQYPSQCHTTLTLFLSFVATFQSHGSVYSLGSITFLESSFQITTQETQLHSAHPHTRTHTSYWSDEPDQLVLHSEDSQAICCYYLHLSISTE